jgi:hypothetical protein
MKKILVSVNGGNNVGKTTFINTILNKNNLYNGFGLIGTEKLDNRNWWFLNSTPKELIDELYYCLLKRDELINISPKRIIFIDKGIKTIQSRIYSTLRIRNMNVDEIEMYINYYIEKCKKIQKEDIEILFEREIEYCVDSDLKKYEIFQVEYLSKMDFNLKFNFGCNFFNDRIINEIEKYIYNFWKDSLSNMLKHTDLTIFVLSGLSESGKSTFGKYIDAKYNIWNLKLRYFNCINNKLCIHENNFFYNLVYIEELICFFHTHYYKKSFSLESFYGIEFLEILRFIFKDHLKLIFIDVDKSKRLERSLGSEEKMLEKDKFKMSVGVDKLKNKCDILINNNGNLNNFYSQINSIFIKEFDYNNITVNPIEQLKIDDTFKKIIHDIETNILQQFRDELLLFSVVGSCATESSILNWSDIDILIIVKKLTNNILKYLSQINLKYPIHIGINCFDSNQVLNMDLDIKNKWYIYYIQQKYIYPSYLNSEFKSPTISMSQLVTEEAFEINELKFSINRMIHGGNKNNTKSLFKDLITLLKIELRKRNIICIRIDDVLKNIRIIWGIDSSLYIDISLLPDINDKKIKEFAENVLKNMALPSTEKYTEK